MQTDVIGLVLNLEKKKRKKSLVEVGTSGVLKAQQLRSRLTIRKTLSSVVSVLVIVKTIRAYFFSIVCDICGAKKSCKAPQPHSIFFSQAKLLSTQKLCEMELSSTTNLAEDCVFFATRALSLTCTTFCFLLFYVKREREEKKRSVFLIITTFKVKYINEYAFFSSKR